MRMRDIVAVVVAVDSALGQEEPTIGQLSDHLPPVDGGDCPLCGPWPCAAFQKAAKALHETGIPVSSLVPQALQARLRSPTPPPVPRAGMNTDPWKGSLRG